MGRKNTIVGYNIIKTYDNVWKLEEVGYNDKGYPYLKHIKLSGDKGVLEKMRVKLMKEVKKKEKERENEKAKKSDK
jgi:hypothetical protein